MRAWSKISVAALVTLLRERQKRLPSGELAVVRVPIALLDEETFRRLSWRKSVGLDVGQSGDLRCSLPDGGSLHLHLFKGGVPYIEAHIDATDPLQDVAIHALEATHILPGAMLGGLLALVTGTWVPAVVLAVAGAAVPSQRRRIVVLGHDDMGLLTVLRPAHPARSLPRGRGDVATVRAS